MSTDNMSPVNNNLNVDSKNILKNNDLNSTGGGTIDVNDDKTFSKQKSTIKEKKKKKKSKRKRCFCCKKKTSFGMGLECKYCNNMFCVSHISPDFHTCPHVDDYLKDQKKHLTDRLNEQKCISSKVLNKI